MISQVIKQYTTNNRLEARIAFHKKYSVNPLGWSRWVYDKHVFKAGDRVLELGCGTGSFWFENKGLYPQMSVVLTDQSQGMVNTCRDKLQGPFTYAVVDAQNIPYEDETFDTIMANHMIYHIPDIPKALKEMYRVLKPGGSLYATTLGKNNMIELYQLLNAYDPCIKYSNQAITGRFGLESGYDHLRCQFDTVVTKRYEDALRVDLAKPLLDYLASLEGFFEEPILDTQEKQAGLKAYLDQRLEKKDIYIHKDGGILIATKSKKENPCKHI